MEVYDSEREQIDSIKKWWKENGKAITTGVVLGAAILIGWQQWSAHTQNQREQASMEFDVLLQELDSNNIEAVKARGQSIANNYQSTPYSGLAALALVKVHVEEGDLAAAATQLRAIIESDAAEELKQVARLRLARVQLADGQADQALTTLKATSKDGFVVVYEELLGDIHVSLGNNDLARQAYEKALDGLAPGMDGSILRMKLDELGGPSEADA